MKCKFFLEASTLIFSIFSLNLLTDSTANSTQLTLDYTIGICAPITIPKIIGNSSHKIDNSERDYLNSINYVNTFCQQSLSYLILGNASKLSINNQLSEILLFEKLLYSKAFNPHRLGRSPPNFSTIS